MRKQRHRSPVDCPMEATLDRMGGKWKSVILYRLLGGTLRFGELRRLLCKITQRTLTQQLRELEADGLIAWVVFAEVPPRVEYSLTERGQTLRPILESLLIWGPSTLSRRGPSRGRRRLSRRSVPALGGATLLAAKLKTPLQIGQHLVRAFEAGFEIGAKPVDAGVVDAIRSRQIDDLEPPLTRNSYD